MVEVTSKAALQKALKAQLSSNPRQAQKALVRLYEHQTRSEQVSKSTRNLNLEGFTTVDARILTSFAEQVINGHTLSEKQLAIAYRLLPKYAGQLLHYSLADGKIKKVDGRYKAM